MKTFTLLLITLLGFMSNATAASQWSKKADYGSFGRHRGVAVGIGNKVYAGTGHLNGDGSDEWYAEWWEYDPATNSWAQKADYIGNNGNGDQDLTAIAIDGIGYVGLGQWGDEEHFKYDPATNIWTQIADAPTAFFSNTDPFVLNGKGYYPERSVHSLFMFDPVLDTWTSVAAMPTLVGHRDPTFVIGSKGYFKHGNSFFEFKPSTNSWTPRATFPGTAPNNNIGLSQHEYGYFIGGYLGWGDMYPEVWRYSPNDDSWTQMEDYPFTSRRWCVKAKIGEKCYMGLGTNGTNFNDFWEFNSVASTEEFSVDKFKAYPTLASEYINFDSEQYQNFEVQIVDLQGKSVASISTVNGKARLDRNSLPSGTYIYSLLIDGNPVHSDRFIFR